MGREVLGGQGPSSEGRERRTEATSAGSTQREKAGGEGGWGRVVGWRVVAARAGRGAEARLPIFLEIESDLRSEEGWKLRGCDACFG